MAQLNMLDEVYNWLVNFFRGNVHCTYYHGVVSSVLDITVSIVQGSGIGPASYVVNASDLRAVTPGNELRYSSLLMTHILSYLQVMPVAGRQNLTIFMSGLEPTISRPT